MPARLSDRWMAGACISMFLLGMHGSRVFSASAQINNRKNCTVAIKEYGGNILIAQIVDDRLVLPAKQLRLSKRCFDLALSPDGKTLAYTYYDDSGQDFQRFIELLDVASGDVRRLTAIASNNSYNPRWSHDGRYIVASVRTMPGIWDVGVIGTDNEHFRIVSQPQALRRRLCVTNLGHWECVDLLRRHKQATRDRPAWLSHQELFSQDAGSQSNDLCPLDDGPFRRWKDHAL